MMNMMNINQSWSSILHTKQFMKIHGYLLYPLSTGEVAWLGFLGNQSFQYKAWAH